METVFIKHLREKRKMTQAQLAEKIGIGQSSVAMWEAGINCPRADKLPELARALGCTIDDLFMDDGRSSA